MKEKKEKKNLIVPRKREKNLRDKIALINM